jgi:hypothetical protein
MLVPLKINFFVFRAIDGVKARGLYQGRLTMKQNGALTKLLGSVEPIEVS